ncbi:response regulator transcription factor [Acaryochloris marina NIES-2412]|uniref:response regulator transcription factor n=1 Tax=Acaryochloris marina TaxID=155978 RepID=UPI00405A4AC7
MRLLLVEDDYPLAAVFAEALEDSGYIVDVVHDGEAGWYQATESEYGIILLDCMLPKLDGLGLCQRLRAHGYTIPILMMTARDASTDKVLGLDAGADDYLVKPVDLPELLARIRAVLRRGKATPSPWLYWGELCLHPLNHEVTYASQPVKLTPTEFSLLELFLRSGLRVLSRKIIISHLWDLEDPPGEETVKAHIKGLRQKLTEAGAPKTFIETIRGVGYRMQPIQ